MIDLIKDSELRRKIMYSSLLIGALIAAVAYACGAYHHEGGNILERPGGMVIFAFLACTALIVMAKLIMTPLLQRDEDYYEKGGEDIV